MYFPSKIPEDRRPRAPLHCHCGCPRRALGAKLCDALCAKSRRPQHLPLKEKPHPPDFKGIRSEHKRMNPLNTAKTKITMPEKKQPKQQCLVGGVAADPQREDKLIISTERLSPSASPPPAPLRFCSGWRISSSQATLGANRRSSRKEMPLQRRQGRCPTLVQSGF